MQQTPPNKLKITILVILVILASLILDRCDSTEEEIRARFQKTPPTRSPSP